MALKTGKHSYYGPLISPDKVTPIPFKCTSWLQITIPNFPILIVSKSPVYKIYSFYQWNKQHTELVELHASPGFVIKLYILGKHHFFSGLERVPY